VTVVVVVIVLLLGAGIVASLFLISPPPPVQVEEIAIYSPNNVCGLNVNGIAYYGFNSSTSANQTLDFPVPNYNSTSCTVHGVTTNTTGFSITYAQVPLTIPAGNAQGSVNASMNVTIISPPSSFSGVLNLIFS
jgi:hypothetical protein